MKYKGENKKIHHFWWIEWSGCCDYQRCYPFRTTSTIF